MGVKDSDLHPNNCLYTSKPTPVLPSCEHYAGSEKFIQNAFSIQQSLGPIFDITCDAEDGAPKGGEKEHIEMIARMITSSENVHNMCGARIHDFDSPFWRNDVEHLIRYAGHRVSYITLPKARSAAIVQEMIHYIKFRLQEERIARSLPIHVLIETHGALRDVWEIAMLPEVEVLDFGLWDFIAEHKGAIEERFMRSPGQFEHQLIIRAKTEIASAAHANGITPSHNVTLAITDATQVAQDALRARRDFGFLRMWSIHPQQIKPIVEAMKPDFSQLKKAGEILLAAQKNNWGPIKHEDQLQDRATYRYYWELLRRARLHGLTLEDDVVKAFFQ